MSNGKHNSRLITGMLQMISVLPIGEMINEYAALIPASEKNTNSISIFGCNIHNFIEKTVNVFYWNTFMITFSNDFIVDC